MGATEDIRDAAACVAQGSYDWFRARLGYITSSNVSKVLLSPSSSYKERIKAAEQAAKSRADIESKVDGKTNRILKAGLEEKYLSEINRLFISPEEAFSDTAKGYLYQVAAERNLRPQIVEDDSAFEEYLSRVELSSRAIRYGQETEDIARHTYELATKQEVAQAGFILHKDIANYGDSPDGIVLGENGEPIGALEIKCPKPDTWMRYKATIHTPEDLKREKPEYYWQCQSHCECNNLAWCDFVFFDKMQRKGFVCIRIPRNDEDITLMKERIVLANLFINSLLP